MSHGNSASKIFVWHRLYQLFYIIADTSFQLEQVTSGGPFQPQPFCNMQAATADSQKPLQTDVQTTSPLSFIFFSSHVLWN